MRFSCCPTQFCPTSEFLTQICCHPPNVPSRPSTPLHTRLLVVAKKQKNRQRSIVIISSSIIIMMRCFAGAEKINNRTQAAGSRRQSAFSFVFFSLRLYCPLPISPITLAPLYPPFLTAVSYFPFSFLCVASGRQQNYVRKLRAKHPADKQKPQPQFQFQLPLQLQLPHTHTLIQTEAAQQPQSPHSIHNCVAANFYGSA